MLTIRDQENLGVLLLDTLLTKIREEYSIEDIFGQDKMSQWAEDNGYTYYATLQDEKRRANEKREELLDKLNRVIRAI